MLSHLGAAQTWGALRVVSTLACVLFCGACSSADPDEPGGGDLFGFVGFMLANALGATDGLDPSDAVRGLEDSPDTTPALASASRTPVLDPPGGEEPTGCEVAYSGPVTIVRVRTLAALEQAMADRRPIQIVYSTEDTAVYEDGRVLTSNVAAAGEHLNALGWAQNPMQILGAATGRRASATSYDWSSGSKRTGRRTRRRRGGRR